MPSQTSNDGGAIFYLSSTWFTRRAKLMVAMCTVAIWAVRERLADTRASILEYREPPRKVVSAQIAKPAYPRS